MFLFCGWLVFRESSNFPSHLTGQLHLFKKNNVRLVRPTRTAQIQPAETGTPGKLLSVATHGIAQTYGSPWMCLDQNNTKPTQVTAMNRQRLLFLARSRANFCKPDISCFSEGGPMPMVEHAQPQVGSASGMPCKWGHGLGFGFTFVFAPGLGNMRSFITYSFPPTSGLVIWWLRGFPFSLKSKSKPPILKTK